MEYVSSTICKDGSMAGEEQEREYSMHGRRAAGILRKSMQNKELTTCIKQSLRYGEMWERSEHILVGIQGKRARCGNELESETSAGGGQRSVWFGGEMFTDTPSYIVMTTGDR